MSISSELVEKLREIDTPTVCNALEHLDPGLRRIGFTRLPLVCPFPDLKPAVGSARTALICRSSANPVPKTEQRRLRLGYYEHVEQGLRPAIAVIQDADSTEPGIGAFWGEVQTIIHAALGCPAVVTDGSVRDIPQMAKDFFVLAGSIMPSHDNQTVHVVDG